MAQDNHKPTTDGTYADGDMVQIPLVNLEPGPNYRSQLRDMDALTSSVYRYGVLSPLWVKPHPTKPNKYTVFSGRRRYEAACHAAQRHARESDSKEALAVQVGRYTVPCRIFRNLGRHKQAIYALVENLVRTDTSTQDTAREVARAKKLLEEHEGRKVSVDEMMTLFEGAGRQGGKVFHRRHVYRLLRIAEMDPRVLEEARRQEVEMTDLEALGRLPSPDMQLALIESIQGDKLTRQEMRDLVNQVLASGSTATDLPALVGKLRADRLSPTGSPPGEPTQGSDRTDDNSDGKILVHADIGSDDGAEPASSARAIPEPSKVVKQEGTSKPLGKAKPFVPGLSASAAEPARVSRPDEGNSRVTAASAVREAERISDKKSMEDWLREVEARLGEEEATRTRKALGEKPGTAEEISLMRIMHMYKGVLPEQLPGYLSQLKENMAQSPWFKEVVVCSMELLGLLGRAEEHKRLHSVPRQLFQMLLSELYRAAAPYDQDLAFYLDRISRFRKEEFTMQPVAKG